MVCVVQFMPRADACRATSVVHENDKTSRTFLDNEMEQKCDLPAGIHDAGTKFWKRWPCGLNAPKCPECLHTSCLTWRAILFVYFQALQNLPHICPHDGKRKWLFLV